MFQILRLIGLLTPLALAYLDHRTKVKEAEAKRAADKAAAEALLAPVPGPAVVG